MTLNLNFLLASAAALGACAGATAANARSAPAPARLIAAEPVHQRSVPALQSEQLTTRTGTASRSGLAYSKGSDRDTGQGQSSRLAPGSADAGRVHAWQQGSAYRLDAAPERVSDIALQPGESLIAVAAGDSVRWIIGDTASGSGPTRRTHILVKPSASGLRTNLVITTDRRVYHVDLVSGARTPVRSISWSYPDDELLALSRADGEIAAAEPVAGAIAVEALNFDYTIQGDRPSWRPLRAFDDGRQVFIEFPPSLGTGEAPPLFVVGSAGGAELVNYRVRGRYYVVDRLFSAAELRLGAERQQIVRITRTDPRRRRGRPS